MRRGHKQGFEKAGGPDARRRKIRGYHTQLTVNECKRSDIDMKPTSVSYEELNRKQNQGSNNTALV